MEYIDFLREVKDSKNVVYSEFITEYRKDTQECTCYGFVEGKDDPSFYRCLISPHLPKGCQIRLYLAKGDSDKGEKRGKKGVMDVFNHFDWQRFDKNRIVFFVDRDLSDITGEDVIVANNVYVTDSYSIENDIINEEVFELVLRQVMGFADTSSELMGKLVSLFCRQKDSFEKSMIVIMANILHWRELKLSIANYSGIQIEDILAVKNGEIVNLKPTNEVLELIYKQSQVDMQHYNKEKVASIASSFESHSHHKKFTRGKYLTAFFIMLCNSIYTDHKTLSIGAISRNHKGKTICSNDLFHIAAPRCRIPDSLKTFIERTLVQYYNTMTGALQSPQ